MPTSKTFASGAPLPAADVNAHLAHIVPVAGATPDTGWLTLLAGSVKVSARRVGMVVTVRLDLSALTGLTDNLVNINGGAPLLPSDMRPADQVYGVGLADQPGVRIHPAVSFAAANGALGIVKPPEASTGLSGTITYLAG